MDGVKLSAEFVVRLSIGSGPELCGEVSVISSNHICRFSSFAELVSIIEHELARECPHLKQRFRSWQGSAAPVAAKLGESARGLWGSQLTFHIGVMFAENFSWQGQVNWLENRRSRYFRSCLELLFLLSEAKQVAASREQAIVM